MPSFCNHHASAASTRPASGPRANVGRQSAGLGECSSLLGAVRGGSGVGVLRESGRASAEAPWQASLRRERREKTLVVWTRRYQSQLRLSTVFSACSLISPLAILCHMKRSHPSALPLFARLCCTFTRPKNDIPKLAHRSFCSARGRSRLGWALPGTCHVDACASCRDARLMNRSAGATS
jgi:hypothetical protein